VVHEPRNADPQADHGVFPQPAVLQEALHRAGQGFPGRPPALGEDRVRLHTGMRHHAGRAHLEEREHGSRGAHINGQAVLHEQTPCTARLEQYAPRISAIVTVRHRPRKAVGTERRGLNASDASGILRWDSARRRGTRGGLRLPAG